MEFKEYGTNPELDMLVHSEDWTDRKWAAQQGYALDALIGDKDVMVRI